MLTLALALFVAAQDVPAPAPTPAAAPAAKPRKICRTDAAIGSRLGRARVCKTQEDWDRDDGVERYRRNPDVPSSPGRN
ncbi:hypothetical protein [Sphingomonas sp.]|uniref:hypothetical protein n=1 Tax=Sphingomonas sp. TaxID=28214 RepID=UPI001B18DB29|nr:hypothetical protein [Sphingomonas sp.]MBO9714838.1 hypothetical protein [Sphingomonas sp.]